MFQDDHFNQSINDQKKAQKASKKLQLVSLKAFPKTSKNLSLKSPAKPHQEYSSFSYNTKNHKTHLNLTSFLIGSTLAKSKY